MPRTRPTPLCDSSSPTWPETTATPATPKRHSRTPISPRHRTRFNIGASRASASSPTATDSPMTISENLAPMMKLTTNIPSRPTPPPIVPDDSSSPRTAPKTMSHILHTPIDSPSVISPYTAEDGGKYNGPGRRQSRFDPMGRDDHYDGEDDGYGELGSRHPLRRVPEESIKDTRDISLPGVKALFGTLPEHPPTPSSSAHSLFYTPSLPSLRPVSPSSSPSTSRNSRYPSLASVSSHNTEFSSGPPTSSGWWAPDFDQSSRASSGTTTMFNTDRGTWSSLSPHRAHRSTSRSSIAESTTPTADEHSDKRRRSDQNPTRDHEEAARLRWISSNRNASFPTSGSMASSGPLRSMQHPPPSTSTGMSFSRSSEASHGASSTTVSSVSPLTPHNEDGEFPFEHRPSGGRNPSIVGGQLAQSFADLTASERSPSGFGEMGPPDRSYNHHSTTPVKASMNRERSPSKATLQVPFSAPVGGVSPRSGPSTPTNQNVRSSPSSPLPPLSAAGRTGSEVDQLRRQSLHQGESSGPSSRRTSLTELIRSKAGDDLAMAQGRYTPVSRVPMGDRLLSEPSYTQSARYEHPGGIPLERPSMSDTGVMVTGWSGPSVDPRRGEHSEHVGSAPMKSRKRSLAERGDFEGRMYGHDEGMAVDGMRGMDILAESARRVSEAEARSITPPEAANPALARYVSPAKVSASAGASGAGKGAARGPGAGPRYPCDFCAKTFSRPSSLRIHRFSHTGERPFVCQEPSCGRSFSVQSNLKRHAKVHLQQPPGRAHPSGLQAGAGEEEKFHPPRGESGIVPGDWSGEEDIDEDDLEEEDELDEDD